MKIVLITVAALALSGCTPSAISMYERSRIAAQANVTAEVNAEDIREYIIANETRRLEQANAAKLDEYRIRLSLAESAEAGAALMADLTNGLAANREAFERELARQLVMSERQLLTGEAVGAVNLMADKEATAAKRAFDQFVANELPRIMEEARQGIAQIQEYNERQRIAEEAERARREAERKEREAKEEEEHEEPEPEPEAPEPVSPSPAPDNTTTDNTGV